MLQRSPTYILSLPGKDPVANWLKARLPADTAHTVTRWKNVILGMAMFGFCRSFPDQARDLIVHGVRRAVGKGVDVRAHFTPTYGPWDQRLCLVPDGDLFKALRSGRADVVTDHIETFTETGIQLRSGRTLPADIVVTATGLRLKFLGGMALDVDGTRVEPGKTTAYRGLMLSDVPNLAFAIGYTNASWTLKVDLAAAYVCRVLNHMEKHGHTRCVPRRTDPTLEDVPLIDFSSGYVKRAVGALPHQASNPHAPRAPRGRRARDVRALGVAAAQRRAARRTGEPLPRVPSRGASAVAIVATAARSLSGGKAAKPSWRPPRAGGVRK
jgi:cation diffusion facilitator CzcD-associated flavoprotein CzcO